MDPHPDPTSFLKSLAPFSGLPTAAVRAIAYRCRPKARQPGDVLFTEGDPCRDLYILAAGRVKCLRMNEEGREQILRIFERPGDMFCTTSAFSTGSHIVTAEAMTDVSLYAIDVETIKRVAFEQPAVAFALITAAAEHMRSLVTLANDLALKTATARVAKVLRERAESSGERDGKGIRLARAALREDELAAMVGTVRVHVSRSLKTLATMGTITLDRHSIYVRDLQALDRFFEALEESR
jgi:CRP-like cAMP-binding protein